MSRHHYTRGALAAGVLLLVLAGWARWPREPAPNVPSTDPQPPTVAPGSPGAPPTSAAPVEPAAAPTGIEPVTVEGHFIEATSWLPVTTTATLVSADGARRSVTSSADGSFSTRLEPGAWRVASADGDFSAASEKAELFVPPSGTLRGVRVRFDRLEWIDGLVLDTDRVPLADARVDDVITDAAGRFRVRSLREPGRLIVSHRCCKPGHSWTEKGGLLVLKLRRWSVPPLGQVRGTLVDPQGQPCRGFVEVEDVPTGSKPVLFPTARDGTFTLPVFESGTRAYALSAGERVAIEPITVGQPVRLVMPCRTTPDDAVLSGRVVDETGAAWSSCSIGAGRRPEGVSDSDGRFAVRVARRAGTWRVFCLGTVGSTEISANLSEGDVAVGDVVLPRAPHPLTGTIRVRATGAPIADANVMIFAGLGMSRAAMSDSTGAFTVNVAKFPLKMLISADGYVPLELQVEASPVAIELTPLSTTDGGVRQEYEGVGLGLASRSNDGGNGLRVTLVAAGGPAEEAGVRVSDELLAVDDVPVTDFGRPRELHERIKGPSGTWVKLSLRREGRVFDVRVQRRRIER